MLFDSVDAPNGLPQAVRVSAATAAGIAIFVTVGRKIQLQSGVINRCALVRRAPAAAGPADGAHPRLKGDVFGAVKEHPVPGSVIPAGHPVLFRGANKRAHVQHLPVLQGFCGGAVAHGPIRTTGGCDL